MALQRQAASLQLFVDRRLACLKLLFRERRALRLGGRVDQQEQALRSGCDAEICVAILSADIDRRPRGQAPISKDRFELLAVGVTEKHVVANEPETLRLRPKREGQRRQRSLIFRCGRRYTPRGFTKPALGERADISVKDYGVGGKTLAVRGFDPGDA